MFDQSPLFVLVNEIAALRRPPVLVRTAKGAQADYCRHRDLNRLVPPDQQGNALNVLQTLRDIEKRHDDARRQACAEYDVVGHITALIALMAEARLHRATA